MASPASTSLDHLRRGYEFRDWRRLKSGIGTDSRFCDPQAPWQKGSVENLNKRARRYLPRDTQLAALSNRYMKAICERLNGTPRKCLGWRNINLIRRRDRKAALKFLRKTMKRYGSPHVLVTDKLRSYGAEMKIIGNANKQDTGRWLNNRGENSHQPFRR